MKKTLCLLMITTLCLSSAVFAKDEDRTLEQRLSDLRLERAQAEVMINRMLKSGRMAPEEALEAKRSIASIQEEDANNIRNAALEKMKSSTNSLANK